jgi:hypothetical protein
MPFKNIPFEMQPFVHWSSLGAFRVGRRAILGLERIVFFR